MRPAVRAAGAGPDRAGQDRGGSRQGRRLAALGTSLGCDVVVARGERALGRVLVAAAEGDRALPHLERALEAFARLEMPLELARTRLLLARAKATEREVAIAEARAALGGFERLGAGGDADSAAAFLRSLGVTAARAGPRGIGVLTKRESEVLQLLGEGLSNREMAERMFITRKTVENHVARVLSKLGFAAAARRLPTPFATSSTTADGHGREFHRELGGSTHARASWACERGRHVERGDR